MLCVVCFVWLFGVVRSVLVVCSCLSLQVVRICCVVYAA